MSALEAVMRTAAWAWVALMGSFLILLTIMLSVIIYHSVNWRHVWMTLPWVVLKLSVWILLAIFTAWSLVTVFGGF